MVMRIKGYIKHLAQGLACSTYLTKEWYYFFLLFLTSISNLQFSNFLGMMWDSNVSHQIVYLNDLYKLPRKYKAVSSIIPLPWCTFFHIWRYYLECKFSWHSQVWSFIAMYRRCSIIWGASHFTCNLLLFFFLLPLFKMWCFYQSSVIDIPILSFTKQGLQFNSRKWLAKSPTEIDNN